MAIEEDVSVSRNKPHIETICGCKLKPGEYSTCGDFSKSDALTFSDLAIANLHRALVWHKGGLEEWSIADWAVAMAGEAGEVCDAVKKLRRIQCSVESNNSRQPINAEAAMSAIAQEIGDTAVYLDLLAQRCGLSLADCIRNTFNRISDREGLPQRL